MIPKDTINVAMGKFMVVIVVTLRCVARFLARIAILPVSTNGTIVKKAEAYAVVRLWHTLVA